MGRLAGCRVRFGKTSRLSVLGFSWRRACDDTHWCRLDFFTPLNNLLKTFDPNGGLPEYLATLFNRLPSRPFEVYETSDLLPLNPWVLSGLLSVDIDRSFASFFAGDVVFPDRVVDSAGCTRRKSEFDAEVEWAELGIISGREKCRKSPPAGDRFEDLPNLRNTFKVATSEALRHSQRSGESNTTM